MKVGDKVVVAKDHADKYPMWEPDRIGMTTGVVKSIEEDGGVLVVWSDPYANQLWGPYNPETLEVLHEDR